MLLEVCQKNVQKHCQTYNAEANAADNFFIFFFRSTSSQGSVRVTHTHIMFLQQGCTLART